MELFVGDLLDKTGHCLKASHSTKKRKLVSSHPPACAHMATFTQAYRVSASLTNRPYGKNERHGALCTMPVKLRRNNFSNPSWRSVITRAGGPMDWLKSKLTQEGTPRRWMKYPDFLKASRMIFTKVLLRWRMQCCVRFLHQLERRVSLLMCPCFLLLPRAGHDWCTNELVYAYISYILLTNGILVMVCAYISCLGFQNRKNSCPCKSARMMAF